MTHIGAAFVAPPPAPLPRAHYGVAALASTGGAWTFYMPTITSSSTSFADGAISATSVQLAGTGNLMQVNLTPTTPIDFTGRTPVFWIKFPSLANVNTVELYMSSDGTTFTNYVKGFQTVAGSNARLMHDGVWVPIHVPWSTLTTTGTPPTRSAINRIRININLLTTAGAEVRVGGIGYLPEPATTYPNGVISFSFDDDLTAAQTAYDRLGRYGFPATLFSYGAIHIDQAGYMTSAQLRALRDTLGWEMGAHAHDAASHVDQSSLTSAQRLSDYAQEKQWLTQAGFATDLYAWPNSTSDEASEIDARKLFHAARGGGGVTPGQSLETIPPAKPMFLRGLTADGATTTLANMTGLVDAAKAGHGWGIFVIHDITAAGTEARSISAANWNSLVDYVATSGVAVRTIGDVLRTPAT